MDHPVRESLSESVASKVATAVWFSFTVIGDVVAITGGLLGSSSSMMVTVAVDGLPRTTLQAYSYGLRVRVTALSVTSSSCSPETVKSAELLPRAMVNIPLVRPEIVAPVPSVISTATIMSQSATGVTVTVMVVSSPSPTEYVSELKATVRRASAVLALAAGDQSPEPSTLTART